MNVAIQTLWDSSQGIRSIKKWKLNEISHWINTQDPVLYSQDIDLVSQPSGQPGHMVEGTWSGIKLGYNMVVSNHLRCSYCLLLLVLYSPGVCHQVLFIYLPTETFLTLSDLNRSSRCLFDRPTAACIGFSFSLASCIKLMYLTLCIKLCVYCLIGTFQFF